MNKVNIPLAISIQFKSRQQLHIYLTTIYKCISTKHNLFSLAKSAETVHPRHDTVKIKHRHVITSNNQQRKHRIYDNRSSISRRKKKKQPWWFIHFNDLPPSHSHDHIISRRTKSLKTHAKLSHTHTQNQEKPNTNIRVPSCNRFEILLGP